MPAPPTPDSPQGCSLSPRGCGLPRRDCDPAPRETPEAPPPRNHSKDEVSRAARSNQRASFRTPSADRWAVSSSVGYGSGYYIEPGCRSCASSLYTRPIPGAPLGTRPSLRALQQACSNQATARLQACPRLGRASRDDAPSLWVAHPAPNRPEHASGLCTCQ